MPLAEPRLPSLAVEQLAEIARRAGRACDVYYGSLALPARVGPTFIHGIVGPSIFTPEYFEIDPSIVAERITRLRLRQRNLPAEDSEIVDLQVQFLIANDAAKECLRRCLRDIPAHHYDVVAFSLAFDAQKLPSATLAKALKQRDRARILFGGTACDGSMGPALLEVFPEIDMVVQGDAETTFLHAVDALTGRCSPDTVPNAVYRGANGVRRSSTQVPVKASLDDVPIPDYTTFISQKQNSEYAHHSLILFFEASRGCWWGAKHHCTFCGLRADGLAYQAKSPSRVSSQIAELQRKYAPEMLYATDAILDMDHLRTLMPELAELRQQTPQLSLFFEIKSNLRREQLALLANAGVREVQPGIESFSTNVLSGIKKGATGIQQVELLKWLQYYRIAVVYGLLIGAHSETADDYCVLTSIASKIHHLQPPTQLTKLVLNQFSPYALTPHKYGITDIRPHEVQHIIYNTDDSELLLRLCYDWDYQHFDKDIAPAKIGELRTAVSNWQHAYSGGAKLVSSGRNGNIVLRRTSAGGLSVLSLSTEEAALLRECETRTSVARAVQRGGHRSGLIEKLERQGLLLVYDEHLLSLPIPTTETRSSSPFFLPVVP